MKRALITHAVTASMISTAFAGTAIDVYPTEESSNGFENLRRPITNPTLFDLAVPTTNVHPIFMYHNLPSTVNSTVGPLAMGGDVQIYALQFEIALTDRLSFVATKDGYVDINPGNTALWNETSGFANLGGGLKYAFILDPANDFALSGSVTYEFPTGNSDVFQGKGNGALNLILSTVKMWDDLQVAAGGGVRLPMDGHQSTNSFVSLHTSYEVTPWFIPLVELNWHHVLSPGSGAPAFPSQAGGLVPVVAQFEGNDLLNFGAANSSANRDLVTGAVGFRSRITEDINLGFAYEVPLTDESNSIIEDRFTVDMIWYF